jgi:hypothetical protein
MKKARRLSTWFIITLSCAFLCMKQKYSLINQFCGRIQILVINYSWLLQRGDIWLIWSVFFDLLYYGVLSCSFKLRSTINISVSFTIFVIVIIKTMFKSVYFSLKLLSRHFSLVFWRVLRNKWF